MRAIISVYGINVDGASHFGARETFREFVTKVSFLGAGSDGIEVELYDADKGSDASPKCTVEEIRKWIAARDTANVTPPVTPPEDAVEVPLAAEVPLAPDEPRQYMADPVRDALTGIMHAGVSL
jgi:hypothetical protein